MPKQLQDDRKQAMAFLLQQQWTLAESLYRRVLRRHPGDYDATHMLGVIALQTGRLDSAIALLTQAVRNDQRHAQAFANLGSALLLANQPDAAIEAYDRALAIKPGFVEALSNIASSLLKIGRYSQAAEYFYRLLTLAPDHEFAAGDYFFANRCSFDWDGFQALTQTITSGLGRGSAIDRPFSFLSVCDSGQAQLKCAEIHTERLVHKAGVAAAPRHGSGYAHDRVRVAYLSADFRDHVVQHLMAPIFERHDRLRFDIVGIALNRPDDSEICRRSVQALHRFVDASAMTDSELAAWLRDQEIDIAVDLTGYTQGCRPAVLARRPAPIQVNFLGYPGTLGAPYMDYIIADEFVVPRSHERFYAERVVRLPGCFHPASPRAVPDSGSVQAPSRAELQLPESGVVFCCFNHPYKLNPQCLQVWSRILQQVPESALWLWADDEAARRRLSLELVQSGIPVQCQVFAQRLPYAKHLARLGAADLFLDTLPFNAGATASDALWAGVPVLTCIGETFAARMAGSLLHAAGLPELICGDWDSYERTAVRLAADRSLLRALSGRLLEQRAMRLFDPELYCRELELAFIEMQQTHATRPRSSASR